MATTRNEKSAALVGRLRLLVLEAIDSLIVIPRIIYIHICDSDVYSNDSAMVQ